jgi:hypothetical protein
MQPFIFNGPTNGAANGRDQRKQAIIQQIMGQGAPAPQNVGQGVGQGLNSLMGGFALQKHNQGAFPTAPGGKKPGFMSGLMNMFGNNGGLY